MNIERQAFVCYHVYLLRDIKFTGYFANHFDTLKLTFNSKFDIKIKLTTSLESTVLERMSISSVSH